MKDLREITTSLNNQMTTLNSRSAGNSTRCKDLETRVGEFRKDYENLTKRLNSYEKMKADKDLSEEKFIKFEKDVKQFYEELDQKTNQFGTVENFVEKFVPIQV